MDKGFYGTNDFYRIIYFYLSIRNRIYLMAVYNKNQKENISGKEKKELKKITDYPKEMNDEQN